MGVPLVQAPWQPLQKRLQLMPTLRQLKFTQPHLHRQKIALNNVSGAGRSERFPHLLASSPIFQGAVCSQTVVLNGILCTRDTSLTPLVLG